MLTPLEPERAARSEPSVSRIPALVREHHAFVWRSLRRLGVPPSDVDDAMQQVFLVLTRRLDDLVENKERAFLFGTAVRVAADHRKALRRRRETTDEELQDLPDPASDPEETADDRRSLAILDSVLETLPEDLRVVFVLFEIEGMEMSDVAQWLGIPQGTVASRLRRAREDFQARARRMQACSRAGRGR